MSSTVTGEIAKLAADLEEAWRNVLENHYAQDDRDMLKNYEPFGLRLYTVDGFTAQFLEEGIEFYPEEGK